MDSANEAIEAGTVAALLAISGILAAKAVPIDQQFRQGSTEDSFVAEMPDAYPGCTVSLNDDETEVSLVTQHVGSATFAYRVPLYVAMFVTSDGTAANDVRKIAWKFGETIQRNLMLYVPNYPVVVYPGTSFFPLQPDSIQPILLDSNTYGLLMKFWAKYQIWMKSD